MLRSSGRHLQIHHSGLDHRNAINGIEVQNPVQTIEGDYDSFGDRK